MIRMLSEIGISPHGMLILKTIVWGPDRLTNEQPHGLPQIIKATFKNFNEHSFCIKISPTSST